MCGVTCVRCRHVRDMEFGTQAIWRLHQSPSKKIWVQFWYRHVSSAWSCFPISLDFDVDWKFELMCDDCFLFPAMQALQLIGTGIRMAPPPGTPRPLYSLMIRCWCVAHAHTQPCKLAAWGLLHSSWNIVIKLVLWAMGIILSRSLWYWLNIISYCCKCMHVKIFSRNGHHN